MKKLRFIAIMIAMIFLLAACGSTEEASKSSGSEEEKTEEVTITHKYGEVTIEKNPKKVVVFDFGVLRYIRYIGCRNRGSSTSNCT